MDRKLIITLKRKKNRVKVYSYTRLFVNFGTIIRFYLRGEIEKIAW